MNYRTLSNAELVRFAEDDPRIMLDPLFAEIVARVRNPMPDNNRLPPILEAANVRSQPRP